MSWTGFVPVALLFGMISTRFGGHSAGWLVLARCVLSSVLPVRVSRTVAGSPVADLA